MNIAVTGGHGLQGSHLATRLTGQGHRVTIFDRSTSAEIPPKCYSIVLRDLRDSAPDFEGFDVVYHLAAQVGGVKFTHGSSDADIMLGNLRIDSNVITAAIDAHIKHFIFASSASVYATPSQQYLDNSLTEADWLDITAMESGYGCAKLSTEAMLYRLQQRGILPNVSVLRLFNVYGPGEDYTKATHAIPELFRKALLEPKLSVYGDGTAQRTFLYVDDAVEAYLRALNSVYAGPINIGNQEVVTIRDLASRIIAITKSDKQVEFDREKSSGTLSCVPNINLARSVLGWEPKVSLNEGLRRTLEWIQQR